MQWRDEGLVIGVRGHGETSVILELMTREHGRHLGLVRGGKGSALRAVLQPGNQVVANWRARLDSQLGAYLVEPLQSRAARLIEHGYPLPGVAFLCALLRRVTGAPPRPRARRGPRLWPRRIRAGRPGATGESRGASDCCTIPHFCKEA